MVLRGAAAETGVARGPQVALRTAAPATGYLHPDYARSFAGIGEPVRLEQAGGWLLRRPIAGGPRFDLAAPYPLFFCSDLSQLARDLEGLEVEGSGPVSAVFITDPFEDGSVTQVLAGFDLVTPFKSHYVAPLDRPWRSYCRKRHRRYARRARRELEICRVDDPASRAEIFWRLYRDLAGRASDLRRLSREIVAAHLRLPGLALFEAADASRVLGLASYMEVGDRAYAHLIAMSPEARRRFATHGLYAAALDYYQERAAAIDFGGNAGPADDPEDGLSRFKQGWTAEVRTAYLCGKILDREVYDSLCAAAGPAGSGYFPAYRASEA